MLFMPKITMFVYAENAFPENTPQGPKLHMVNPQHIFRPIVPGLFSFSVVFGVLDFDTSVPHNVRFKFYAPDGSVLIEIEKGM